VAGDQKMVCAFDCGGSSVWEGKRPGFGSLNPSWKCAFAPIDMIKKWHYAICNDWVQLTMGMKLKKIPMIVLYET